MSTNEQILKPHSSPRRRFWQDHIDQWALSGMSRMAYCREHALAYHQMLYWHKQLTQNLENSLIKDCPGKKLVPVQLLPTPSSVPLSLVLSSGVTLHDIVPENLDCVCKLIERL